MKLTPREREIAALIGQGLTSKAIAIRLGLSDRTVRCHVNNALRVNDCRTRAELAVRSMEAAA
jgi:two-component system, NarL family, nitrate/nitrite response regulator NarL